MSLIDDLCNLLEEAGAKVTFSAGCRTGPIGDLCRCWRCRGLNGPSEDESASARDTEIADRASRFGQGMADMQVKMLIRSLSNVRQLAKRLGRGTMEPAEASEHLLRFCDEAGVIDLFLRDDEPEGDEGPSS